MIRLKMNGLRRVVCRQQSTFTFGKRGAGATSSTLSNVVKPTLRNTNVLPQRKIGEKNEIVKKYVLHCNFTKNNTHFTYCAVMEDLNFLQNNPQLSYNDKLLYYMKLPSKVKAKISTGCLGFRKAARGEYEAGFQTANKIFQMIQEKNLMNKDIEIVMKDFGKGRTAFIAALNGKEGTAIRKYVKKISDATPLKFGGVRSPKMRRL